MDLSVLIDQHDQAGIGFFSDALPVGAASDEQSRGDRVGKSGVFMDDGDGLRFPGGVTGAWVEDVMIALTIMEIDALIIARGEDAFSIVQVNTAEHRTAVGVTDADAPGRDPRCPFDGQIHGRRLCCHPRYPGRV